MSILAPLLTITAPKPSKSASVHLLKFLAIYILRGHLQKYPSPKLKLKLHCCPLFPRHSTTLPSPKISVLQRFSNPDLQHSKSFGHSIPLIISSICVLCSCVISIANLTFSVPSLGSHRLPLFHNSTSDYITRSIKKPLLIAASKKQGLTKKLYVLCYILTNRYFM